MISLRIFLVCFVCIYIKDAHSKTCNRIPKISNNWFLACSSLAPCTCSSSHKFCVMDEERECTGCVRSDYRGLDYSANCHCAGDGCRCEVGQRWCKNHCVAREDHCEGTCQGDDRLCNGKCIKRDEVCDKKCEGEERACRGQCIGRREICHGNSCGELDWVCNGECIRKKENCYGISYTPETNCGEDSWKCDGKCILKSEGCYGKCNEALGYWKCGKHCMQGGKDRWESKGLKCVQKKPTNNNVTRQNINPGHKGCWEGGWFCNETCIPRTLLCQGNCSSDLGDWKCGDECKKEEEKESFKDNGMTCLSLSVDAENNGYIVLIVFSSIFSFFVVCFTVHAIVICRRYRAIQREDINILMKTKKQDGCFLWALLHAKMYLSGRMFWAVMEHGQIKRAEMDFNKDYEYGEPEEDIELVDYNEYYGQSDEETED